MSLPNSIPLNSNDLYTNNSISKLGKKVISSYELPNNNKLDSMNDLLELQEVSNLNKKQN
jgi:hypothetical protein